MGIYVVNIQIIILKLKRKPWALWAEQIDKITMIIGPFKNKINLTEVVLHGLDGKEFGVFNQTRSNLAKLQINPPKTLTDVCSALEGNSQINAVMQIYSANKNILKGLTESYKELISIADKLWDDISSLIAKNSASPNKFYSLLIYIKIKGNPESLIDKLKRADVVILREFCSNYQMIIKRHDVQQSCLRYTDLREKLSALSKSTYENKMALEKLLENPNLVGYCKKVFMGQYDEISNQLNNLQDFVNNLAIFFDSKLVEQLDDKVRVNESQVVAAFPKQAVASLPKGVTTFRELRETQSNGNPLSESTQTDASEDKAFSLPRPI